MALIENSVSLGIFFTAIAAIAYGTHSSFLKIKRVRKSRAKVAIFTIYLLFATVIIDFIIYFALLASGAANDIEFTSLAYIYAIMYLIGEIFLLSAAKEIGVAYTQAFVCCIFSIFSIPCQIFIGEKISNYYLMIFGLILTIVSVLIIILLPEIMMHFTLSNSETLDETLPLISEEKEEKVQEFELTKIKGKVAVADESVDEIGGTVADESADYLQTHSMQHILLGLLYSVIAGVFLSAVWVPTLYVDENSSQLLFLYSAGIAQFVTLPLCILFVFCIPTINENGEYILRIESTDEQSCMEWFLSVFYGIFCCCLRKSAVDLNGDIIGNKCGINCDVWQFKEIFLPGCFSGLLIGLGNVALIIAVSIMDYIIVLCVINFSIVVSLVCGIFLWDEIRTRREILIVVACVFTLLVGAAIVVIGVNGY